MAKKTPSKKTSSRSSTLSRPKKIAILFGAAFAAIGIISLFQAHANPKNPSTNTSAVTLFVTPSSQKLSVNNNVTVSVNLNTNGQSVNAVQANLTYPSDKLEFVSFDSSTSAFSVEAQSQGGSGVIKIARGNISPIVSSSALISNIVFRPISAGRRVNLSFSSDSNVEEATNNVNILAKTIGGQYSIN